MVVKHKLLGDFHEYLDGSKSFIVPVYAVWGNHDDPTVIKMLKSDSSVKNLHLLDSDNQHQLSVSDTLNISLFGLGGNFLASKKLLSKPLSGQGGKIWATLHEFGKLYQALKSKSKPSIFVSHVSPGKEPLLTKLISHYMPDFWG